jgi:hypothetical protein
MLSTLTGYRIMVRHLVELIGHVELVELWVGMSISHVASCSTALTCLSISRFRSVAG